MRRLVALTALLLPACGGGSTNPTAAAAPVTPARADIVVTADPNPVIAEECRTAANNVCGTSTNQFVATTAITIREAAGLGGNVNFINVTLRDVTTGIAGNTLNYGADEVARRAGGTNHINALGSLTVRNVGVVYTLPFNGREATMTITVSFGDDKGNTINNVITVRVV
jgi:hypothetical protein